MGGARQGLSDRLGAEASGRAFVLHYEDRQPGLLPACLPAVAGLWRAPLLRG